MLYGKLEKRKQGFTLIELSVVIAIITILATISVPNVTRYLAKSRDAKRISDIQVIVLAMESFYDDRGHYPGWGDNALLPAGVELGDNGECIGVVGRGVATTGDCRIQGLNDRVDGAVDILLRPYIHGPIPRDPLYDHDPDQYFYGYDPHHYYYMPVSISWNDADNFPTPAGCGSPLYPNAGAPGNNDNRTAVVNIHRFETDGVEKHRDECGGGTLNISTSDYNIAFGEVGLDSGDGNDG